MPPILLQFRLLTFLAGFTVLTVLGYCAARWYYSYLEDQAVQAVRNAGGRVLTNEAKRVHRIYFGGPAFGDEELRAIAPHLRYLPELRELDLVSVSVSDAGIESLAGLDQVKEVYVFESEVTEAGIRHLSDLLPYAEVKTEAPDPVASGLAATNIYPHAMVALAWSLDGARLATGSGDGRVRLWNLGELQPDCHWTAHEEWAFSTDFSPDGSLLATGGGDNIVRLWDPATQRLLAELRGHTDDVHAVKFTPDGAALVSAGDDVTIRIWDLARHSVLFVLSGHKAQIPAIAVSPDGSTVASASRDATVRLWDRRTGALISILAGHEDDVMAVAFNSRGDWLASAAYDGTIRLWNLRTHSDHVLLRHNGRAYSVAFNASGNRLASSGEDGVLIWDFSSAKILDLRDQKNVSHVAFCGERPILATTNAAGELRLLNARTGETLNVLRTRYGERGLSVIAPLAHCHRVK